MIDYIKTTKYFASVSVKASPDLVFNLTPIVNELDEKMHAALIDIEDITIYLASLSSLTWKIEGDHTEFHGVAVRQHEMILDFLKAGGLPEGWELV